MSSKLGFWILIQSTCQKVWKILIFVRKCPELKPFFKKSVQTFKHSKYLMYSIKFLNSGNLLVSFIDQTLVETLLEIHNGLTEFVLFSCGIIPWGCRCHFHRSCSSLILFYWHKMYFSYVLAKCPFFWKFCPIWERQWLKIKLPK